MSSPSTEHVDVRDMLCAQALALVSKAMNRAKIEDLVEVVFNSEDVRSDLNIWINEKKYILQEETNEKITIKRN